MARTDTIHGTHANIRYFLQVLICLAVFSINARTQDPDTTELPIPAKRFALVIGVEDYGPGIASLKGPDKDAHDIKDALVRYGGFPQDQVVLMTSDQTDPDYKPSRSQILRKLHTLDTWVAKDGLLVIAFSGHGIEENGEAFLLPSDAELSPVELLSDTSVSISKLRGAIKKVGIKQVIILLDSCRDDPVTAKSASPGDTRLSRGFLMRGPDWDKVNTGIEAFAVLYATGEGQKAYISRSRHQGYFSWVFVEGISGGAKNAENKITLGGLVRYLQERVPPLVHSEIGVDKEQNPFIDVRGFKAEDLVLASIPANIPNGTYSISVRMKPVFDEQETSDQRHIPQEYVLEKDSSLLLESVTYGYPVPANAKIKKWSYQATIMRLKSGRLTSISLSDITPEANGVKSFVSSDGQLTIDVTVASSAWH